MSGFFLALIFIAIYLLFVKKLVKDRWWFLSLPFLLISPWFIQLLLSSFEFWWSKPLISRIEELIESISINSSFDYLFFQGDPRVKFGTQESGIFYVFQITLLAFGFYAFLEKLDKIKKIMLSWLLAGFFLASFFASSPDFSNGLFYFLPLQIISFLGLVQVGKSWQSSASWLKKSLILLLVLWAIYEVIIFFHILIVHYPKRLLIQ